MDSHLERELLDWYAQFTIPADRKIENWSYSWFKKVETSEIDFYEKKFGFVLPELYREFLIKIGEGRLASDKLGGETIHYANTFMGPKRISEIVSKRSKEWEVYPDFIASDDLPFFDLGNQSVLVFNRREFAKGTVYYPSRLYKIASTFNEFLSRLSIDITFYIDEIIGAQELKSRK